MFKWICHLRLRPAHPPREGPEDTPFTNAVKNQFAKGAPASLKGSVIALLGRSDLIVGTAAAELGTLDAMVVFGFQRGRGQWVAFNHQRQGVTKVSIMDSRGNAAIRIAGLTQSLWRWLTEHDATRSETGSLLNS